MLKTARTWASGDFHSQTMVSDRTSPCQSVLGGSWDLVSKVISTLIGVISNYKYSYLIYNPGY